MIRRIQSNQFVEHGEYGGHFYGLSIDTVKTIMNGGKIGLLTIVPRVTYICTVVRVVSCRYNHVYIYMHMYIHTCIHNYSIVYSQYILVVQALKLVHLSGEIRAHVVFFVPPTGEALHQWFGTGLVQVRITCGGSTDYQVTKL